MTVRVENPIGDYTRDLVGRRCYSCGGEAKLYIEARNERQKPVHVWGLVLCGACHVALDAALPRSADRSEGRQG